MNRYSTEPEYLVKDSLDEKHRMERLRTFQLTDSIEAQADLVELSQQVMQSIDLLNVIRTRLVILRHSLEGT